MNVLRKNRKYLGSAIITLLLPFAFAAQAATVPGPAAPEHLQKRFLEPEAPPKVEPATRAPALVTPPLQLNPQRTFILRDVELEGVTVYSDSVFDAIIDPKINKTMTFAEASALARTITDRYRGDGYILSQAIVTNNDLLEAEDSGVLHIKVVEGFIHNVILENDKPEADRRGLIETYANKISAERPLSTAALERYMLLINDLPGVTARAIIRPSPDTFGAADLVVQVKNKPLEASLTGDNRGNKFLGPFQGQATVTENSVAGLGERTTLRVINTVPVSEVHYLDIQHEEQVGTEGTRVIAIASFAKTNPDSLLKPLDFKGVSNYYALTVTHPFLRSRPSNFNGRFTLDGHDTENDSLGVRLNNDRVRAVRVGGTYDVGDGLDGVDLVDAAVSHGVSWFGATDDGAGRSRTVAKGSFKKINLDVSRLQNLPHGFSLVTAASGQFTRDALLISEQFTLGGVGFGQAYDNGELSGDKGLAGKVELRYGQPVGEKWLDSYQLYGYYDLGSVFLNDTAPGTNKRLSLASVGSGVRVNFTPNLYGYVELGLPLTRSVASTGDNDPRIFASLTARY